MAGETPPTSGLGIPCLHQPKSIASTDPEIAGAIDEERRRQEEHIE